MLINFRNITCGKITWIPKLHSGGVRILVWLYQDKPLDSKILKVGNLSHLSNN